jgi:hypothetical protein
MDTACGAKVIGTTNIKDSLRKIKKKDMGSILGAAAICTKASIAVISGMETVKCTGVMVLSIKESGSLTSRMEKVRCLMEGGRWRGYFKTGNL